MRKKSRGTAPGTLLPVPLRESAQPAAGDRIGPQNHEGHFFSSFLLHKFLQQKYFWLALRNHVYFGRCLFRLDRRAFCKAET
jgi:hypothetical protein